MAGSEISSIIPYAVNFSIVVAIGVYYGCNPLRKFIYQRHERQKDLLEFAAKEKEESKKRIEKMQALLSKLPEEKKRIFEETRRLNELEIKSILDKPEKEKNRLNKDIEEAIRNEKLQTRKALRNQFVDKIVKTTESKIKLGMKEVDHRALVSMAIQNTESHKETPSYRGDMEVDT